MHNQITPYKVPLNNHVLAVETLEMLKSKIFRNRLSRFFRYKVHTYEEDALSLTGSFHCGGVYEQKLLVRPDSLEISCNCNVLFKSDHLCSHVVESLVFFTQKHGYDCFTSANVSSIFPVISMSIDILDGCFDITVSVRFGDISLTLTEIRHAVLKKLLMIRLSNGKIGHLPDTFFEQLSPLIEKGTLSCNSIKVPTQHYTLIAPLRDNIVYSEQMDEVFKSAKLLDEQTKIPLVGVPENLNAVLRPYQQIGFSWLSHLDRLNWGGLLADDMGLGKTLQVLSLLQDLKNKGQRAAPHLLIAPASLLFNWFEEAARFCPELNVMVYHGLKREKDEEKLMKYDLIVTSYGTVAVDILRFKKMKFQYLILDEAQAIKSPASQKFKMVSLLDAQNRLALSGTPVENNSTDLYALIDFTNPGFLGSLKMFKSNFATKGGHKDTDRSAALLKLTKPFILRRTKNQVATDLPPKTEMTLWCEMEPAQRKIYEEYRKGFKAYLTEKIDKDGLEKSKLYVLDGLMKLRQICNSPVLIKDTLPFDGTSCKIKELLEHVVEKTAGHKLLVFSQFTGMLGLIRTELEREGIGYAYLDGKTKLSMRKKAVSDFQDNISKRVFLISLKAGGTGLNLTSADYVYLVDPWWSPAAEAQAIDRCYRIGQKKHVMAYRMICRDTIEEKILEIQDKKRKLADQLLPTGDGGLGQLDKADILNLFE
ncbi:DEAD/DEAH box helicase [Pedobacter nyackensis]|uniref:DEAD/DEAH box helicase n=1 Tax=Pedobacter nyackensis TaxID=475255 RepID=UPI00292DFE3F|nr:DEAD/DEAH box helicase [Pedobacter nyackensis]